MTVLDSPGLHERAPAQGPPTASPGPRTRWQRARLPVGAAVAVALAAVFVTLLGGSGANVPLDPDSTWPDGTHALGQLLVDRGLHVQRARSVQAALDEAPVGAPVTVVVVQPQTASVGRLASGLPAGSRVVLVEPGPVALDALLPGVQAVGGPTGVRGPGCGLRAALTAGPVLTSGGYAGAADAGCYAGPDGAPALVVRTGGTVQVVALAGAEPLVNAHLAEQGDAALALGLLSGPDTVVWLQPRAGESGREPGDGGPSLYALLPSRLWWALLQVGVALAVLALWRGRRLGRVVREPLPVVVRAAEAVEGKARLYRAARARDRAAAALRAGALHRLRPRLGLGPDALPEAVVAAIAARTRGDASGVRSLLFGPAPSDDEELVALTYRLDTLEREVRRS